MATGRLILRQNLDLLILYTLAALSLLYIFLVSSVMNLVDGRGTLLELLPFIPLFVFTAYGLAAAVMLLGLKPEYTPIVLIVIAVTLLLLFFMTLAEFIETIASPISYYHSMVNSKSALVLWCIQLFFSSMLIIGQARTHR